MEIECSKYFFVKKGKDLLQIDDFLKQIKKSRSFLITHDLLERNTYLYRKKEYEYKELFNEKVLNLEIPKLYEQILDNIKFKGEKTIYLLRLIETLDRYIRKARYELIKSSNIIDIDFLNSDYSYHNYDFYYIQRCSAAENAIYSYYSTFEILMQIIWVYKEFYKRCYKGYNFEKIVKTYNFETLKTKLKQKDSILLQKFCLRKDDKYLLHSKFYQVRKWCNDFKHNGILRFDGEKIYTINSDLDYKYLDMDNKVIPELINYHNEVLKLSNYIISNIEF